MSRGCWNYRQRTNGGPELVTAVLMLFTFSMTAHELGASADDITSIKLYEMRKRMLYVIHDLEICFFFIAFLKIIVADETRFHEIH
jgi:hypothetical protein